MYLGSPAGKVFSLVAQKENKGAGGGQAQVPQEADVQDESQAIQVNYKGLCGDNAPSPPQPPLGRGEGGRAGGAGPVGTVVGRKPSLARTRVCTCVRCWFSRA